MSEQIISDDKHKSHQKPHSGRKHEKKIKKSSDKNELKPNSKAFAIKSAVKAERLFRRKQDIISKREHIPLVDRTPLEPSPYVVAVVGPQKVGKTTLIRCLIKSYTRMNLRQISGPVTVVSAKKRRLTLIECNNDINSLIDIAKVADLVLLLVDASFGFEMETFEFLNICQSHGFPRIMGVLTHLDVFKNQKALRKTKKILKHRFWTEIYSGAKLFYLSGMIRGEYLKNEIHNLCRFISVIKFRPLQWITSHPYLIVDRIEDLTNQELVRQNPKCNRTVCLFGYSRGSNFKKNNEIHIPGCGDFVISDISFLSDPCPLPNKDKQEKRRSLNEKERLIYAPMSGVGGIVYDKDAVYIDLGGSHSHKENESEQSTNDLVSSIISSRHTIDEKIASTQLKLFSNTEPTLGTDVFDDKRVRRKVTFDNELNFDENDSESDNENNSEDESLDEEKIGQNSENNLNEENEEMLSSDDGMESDNEEDNYSKWKNNLSEKASIAFYNRLERTENVQKLVYGDSSHLKDDDYYNDVRELSDGLFKIVEKRQEEIQRMKTTLNSIECTKFPPELLIDWNNEDINDSSRDCFVTGKWSEKEDATKLLAKDDAFDDSDEEIFGDFEDLETGEKHTNETQDNDKSADEKEDQNEDQSKARMEKKRKMKEAFDAEYDVGDKGREEKTFYDEVKEKLDQQTQV
jgi:ribosome biogenesis protein BMS1